MSESTVSLLAVIVKSVLTSKPVKKSVGFIVSFIPILVFVTAVPILHLTTVNVFSVAQEGDKVNPAESLKESYACIVCTDYCGISGGC